MLPHKVDQSFISVPVSRIGLSTRLNQLNGLNSPSRPSSRSATPATYVASSLNPTRNVPVSLTDIRLNLSAEELESFLNLPITQSLAQFETTFNELSQSVASFKEDEIAAIVARLIGISDEISRELQVLKYHQELGDHIGRLEKTNAQLDGESKDILRELISCRALLKALPKLPAKEKTMEPTEISVQGLLDYAMKLAKFSKAPPTVMSQMIHPNNYIWPAEDALRRGMLAMASLKPDELVRAEIGEPEPEDVEMEEAQPEVVEEAKVEHVQRQSAPKVEPAPTLDLDLFDPDEDDSD